MAWIVKLVSIGAEGEEHSTDVMRIARPGSTPCAVQSAAAAVMCAG